MIGFKFHEAKAIFFDRAQVLRAVDKATRKVLSKFGAFVRTTARHSIKKRKKSAPAGSPPSSHTGLLKKFIFFGYDSDHQSVVIGPARLNAKKTNAPQVLEHGGIATIIETGRKKRKQRHKLMAARPFMAPAFTQEESKLPALWRDSVRA